MDGSPLVLESVTMRGDVAGVRLDAQITQCFRNPGERHVEVVYTFPLPWEALLLGIEVELGEKQLSGVVVERRRAEAAFEDAIAEGDAAIMIERNPDESYTLNLGNLGLGETCNVRIRYAQTLGFDPTGLRLTIPTVIAPRYGDPIRQGRLQPHQVIEHDPTVSYPFSLELTLSAALARAKVASPTHPTAMQLEADGRLRVSLAREGALDRDFVLTLSALDQTSLGQVAPDTVRSGTSAVLMSFCPRIARSSGVRSGPDSMADSGAVSVKLLVDCSGSMAGDSIQAARRALNAIVGGLTSADRFSLSRFGSHVTHRSRSLWRATEATRLAANRWVGELEADMGGTNMEAALASLFEQGREEAHSPTDVLLITDGHIHAIDQTIGEARASGHRIFVVAIGSSPSSHFLRRLAEETGGACDFVSAGEAVQPAVERMFARLRSPRRVDLALRWPQGVNPEWVSPISPAIFDGDTVTVYASVRGSLDGEVELVGRQRSGEEPELIARAVLDPAPNDEALPRIVAAARLRALADVPQSKAEALQLALDYQLVGDETNFLLVHERAAGEKAKDMPELVKVKSMVPAGYGGFASVAELSCDYAMSCEEPPAIMRSARRIQTETVSANYEIPAFLRKPDADRSVSAKPSKGAVRTPGELLEWLDATEIDAWPSTFAELRELGLSAALLDWIELVGAPGRSETERVALFIAALCSQPVWNHLGFRPGEGGTLRSGPHGWPGDARDTETIVAMLERASLDDWPVCVDALSVA
ncbi:MAG TPA: VIT domain-containing protein [Azoarcus taiwanensis]|nr:VIT domain-containing protein [Azoarcus taiwanensis]